MDFSIESSGIKNDLKHQKGNGGIENFNNTILFFLLQWLCYITISTREQLFIWGIHAYIKTLYGYGKSLLMSAVETTSELYGAARMLKRPQSVSWDKFCSHFFYSLDINFI